MLNSIKWKIKQWKRYIRFVPRKVFRYFVAKYYYYTIAKRKHCIYVKFPQTCRLGNQMFMTAFGETLKKKSGLQVCYYTKYSGYYLEEIDPWIYKRFRVMTFQIPMIKIFEETDLHSPNWEEQIRDSLKLGNVLISGYFEDIRLLDVNLLRSIHIRPSWVTKTLTRLYGNLTNCASIHVRRGDFVKLGVSLGMDYYLDAMSRFPRNTKFLIISDDLEWCRLNFKDCGYSVIIADKCWSSKQSLYLDLFLPSMCQIGNILSGSSFSWWGSVLNDNPKAIRVMPHPWWNDTDKHLYLKNTIIISTKNRSEK